MDCVLIKAEIWCLLFAPLGVMGFAAVVARLQECWTRR